MTSFKDLSFWGQKERVSRVVGWGKWYYFRDTKDIKGVTRWAVDEDCPMLTTERAVEYVQD